ncbi:hypothetical protein F3C99_14085 [Vitellibacter sp. q18]|jgi:hypothetical protein|nr:hypothetical protein [Aequorivita lutea]
MKNIVFAVLALVIVSCSTEKKQEEVVRELAKKDLIEKLQLPEGTKFSNEDVELKETSTGEASLGVTYIVKITVKSQDRDGNEIVKIYTMNYKKIGEGGLAPEDYELTSFE